MGKRGKEWDEKGRKKSWEIKGRVGMGDKGIYLGPAQSRSQIFMPQLEAHVICLVTEGSYTPSFTRHIKGAESLDPIS